MASPHSRLHHRDLATLGGMSSSASDAASSLSAAPNASRRSLPHLDTDVACGNRERDPDGIGPHSGYRTSRAAQFTFAPARRELRSAAGDSNRNDLPLALLTMGEGGW